MKYNREDLPKIIFLSVILLGVLIFIGVRYAQVAGEHKARLAAQEARREAAEQAAQAAQASPVAQTAAAVEALIRQVPPPERDPFRPVIPPRIRGTAATTQTPQQPDAPPTPPPPVTPGAPDLPPLRGAALHVTGIVAGTPTVAVLRFGEEHYVVREGDVLNGGLRVQTIAASTVTLRDSQNTYVLRLGY